MQLTVILGRRLLGAAALIAAVLALNFILIHLAPGDPALTIAGGMGGATEEMLRDIRQAYGLDHPLHHQLLVYMERMLSGDLGHSLFFNAPVVDLILARLGPTILLVIAAMSIALTLGTFLGVLASRKPGGVVANLVTLLSLAGYSAPVFWTGIVLLLVFSATIPLFPLSGMYDVRLESAGLVRALDVAHHDRRQPGLRAGCMVGGDPAGACHIRHRAGRQSHRRRADRRPQPETARPLIARILNQRTYDSVSCVFCIMASRADLRTAARLQPELASTPTSNGASTTSGQAEHHRTDGDRHRTEQTRDH